MKDTIYREDAIDVVNSYLGLSAVSRTIHNMMSIQEILEKLPSAQPEPHGVCMDCLMKNVCRFKTGLGDYGYCSQWRGEDQ